MGEYPFDMFHVKRASADGYNNVCKPCKKIKNELFYANNRESKLAYQKEYQIKNKEVISAYKQEYDKTYAPKYYEKNKEKKLAYSYEYHNERRKTDENFRLASLLRSRFHHALKNGFKMKSVIELVGCTIEEFKLYVESLFYPEMTWENHGDIWEIDHILPCNGTKYYRYAEGMAAKYEISMIDELGQEGYNRLVEICLRGQLEIMGMNKGLPLTGNFFQYRGSLLNWCPIGRAAKREHRAVWERLDEGNRIRMPWLNRAREEFVKSGIEGLVIALGGETSFDIYPIGWDKTYAMKHFKGYKIYFIGDRCRENGNDHAIYEACRPNSWSTTGPEQTMLYIEQIIDGEKE